MTDAAAGSWIAALPAETEALAAAFSDTLPPVAEHAAVVHLEGDLGSGKTTWARGFLQARGVDRVRSPTFPLLETYVLRGLTVAHLDLYRLADPDEAEALGLRDLDGAGHLWLVEWPARGAALLPAPDLVLHFEALPAARRITARAASPLGTAWLHGAALRINVSSKV